MEKFLFFQETHFFFLVINVVEASIQYAVIYKKGEEKYEIIHSGVDKKWLTRNGYIYDFQEFKEALARILEKTENATGIKCKEVIVCISLNYFKLYNKHQVFNRTMNSNDLQGMVEDWDRGQFTMVHDCGSVFLVNNTLPLDNIEEVDYERLDIYSSVYLIPSIMEKNIVKKANSLGLNVISLALPQYLLCWSLSENMNNDIILIEIGSENSIIILNHKKFSYNCVYLNKGFLDFVDAKQTPENHSQLPTYKMDTSNLNSFLTELINIAKANQKATIVLAGPYAKKLNMVQLLQRLSARRFFYLEALLSSSNNGLFFNLIHNYCHYLLPKNFFSEKSDYSKDSILDRMVENIL
jgi:hypothetical protein